MQSNYKKIGKYVKQVSARNNDLSVTSLKGININKHFMPSVANINGTDLSKYRVVSKGQFAFNPMHVGRDEILPISMLEEDDKVIASPAYVVFEIVDKKELLPEYLMMWCRRPEFDRNAWFTTDNSVRGGFSWSDFCDMDIPVPSLDKQREIVKEHNVIVNLIKLNEQLNQKLEETAQAIYKQWFVDFEFPVSAEYAASIGKPEIEGKPYKSSGGEMVYCDELEQDIPRGYTIKFLGDSCELITDGKHGDCQNEENSGYYFVSAKDLVNGEIDYANVRQITKKDFEETHKRTNFSLGDILLTNSGTIGRMAIGKGVPETPRTTFQKSVAILKPKKNLSETHFLYCLLKSNIKDLIELAGGTSQSNLLLGDLKKFLVLLPSLTYLKNFEETVAPIFAAQHIRVKKNKKMIYLKNILLSKIATLENTKEIAA